MTDRNHSRLDRLLSEVGSYRAEPSEALLSRIVADARRVRSQTLSVAGASGQTVRYERAGWLGALFGLFCDWPTVGGLVGCLIVGLALGVLQPGALRTLASLSGDTVRISVGVDENPLGLLGG